MKKYLLVLVTGLFIMAMIAGCSAPAATTYTDPSKTIDVSNGQEFTVVLDGNYTTGYMWESSFDQGYIKLVSQDYKQNESKDGMVGVPGKASFVFKALKQGNTQITFTYKRPSETTPADQKVFNIAIK